MCQKPYSFGTDATNYVSSSGRILFRQQIHREEEIIPAAGTFELSQTFFRSLAKKWPASKELFCEEGLEESGPGIVIGSFRLLSIVDCLLRISKSFIKLSKILSTIMPESVKGKKGKKREILKIISKKYIYIVKIGITL